MNAEQRDSERESQVSPPTRHGPLSGLLWLPVLGFAILISLMVPGASHARYEPRLLLPGLNAVFLSFAGLLIALLSARTYLAGGSAALLPMGGGMLIVSFASILSGMIVPIGRVDQGVAVFTIAMCLAGLGQLVGAVISLPPSDAAPRRRWPWLMLALTYASALLTVGSVSYFVDAIPPFYIPGQGMTLVRKVVLGGAIAQFGGAAMVMLVANREPPSKFLHCMLWVCC